MKKLFDARMRIYSVGLVISSAMERIITSVINEHIELGLIQYHVLSLVLLTVLFILNNILLMSLSQKEFIKKMILGKKYIGGLWIEVVINENDQISHITKIEITYDNDIINVHGDCYVDGEHSYYFDSVCSVMENHKLSYFFIAQDPNGMRDDIGYLNFDPNSKKLDKYSGYYEDKGMKFRIRAIKIENKLLKNKVNYCFNESLKEILPELKKRHGCKFSIPDFINSLDKDNM